MPKRKKTDSLKTKSIKPSKNVSNIKLGESYTSLILGAIVVVVAALLVFSFFKGRPLAPRTGIDAVSTTLQDEIKKEQEIIEKQNTFPKTYEVKSGDDLWDIAEKNYGTGYKWTEIAKTNNLDNPNVILTGTKLVLPTIENKQNSTSNLGQPQQSIKGNSYTVQKGDYLWDIAVRAYGDGYRWIKIANENHLANPDMIFSGNILSIPR